MKQEEIAEKSLEKWMHAIDSNSDIFNKKDIQTLIQAMFYTHNPERVVFVDDKFVLPQEVMLRSVVQVMLDKKRDGGEITQQQFSTLSTLLGLGDFPEFLLKAKYTNKSYNDFKQSLYDDE